MVGGVLLIRNHVSLKVLLRSIIRPIKPLYPESLPEVRKSPLSLFKKGPPQNYILS